MSKKVYIIPCSGMGKVYGSICRQAAYRVVNDLKPGKTAIECLPLIVKGKKEVVDELKKSKVITLDGCTAMCAYYDVSKVIEEPDAHFLSTSIVMENRDLKPEADIYPLGENANALMEIFAKQVAEKVGELLDEQQ
ncbi:MAG TPA: putative zinc-binding protein [Candidatus Bathyarchaeia archaeon]|nr:putative zinc-binding protein [Candidatus Bathyarchaeia archaeon]